MFRNEDRDSIHVDANGSVIRKTIYSIFEREIECDTRGYAYYLEYGSYNEGTHTPILVNGKFTNNGLRQAMCKEL